MIIFFAEDFVLAFKPQGHSFGPQEKQVVCVNMSCVGAESDEREGITSSLVPNNLESYGFLDIFKLHL